MNEELKERLSEKQIKMATYYATSSTVKEAEKLSGISNQVFYYQLNNNEDFREFFEDVKAEFEEHKADELYNLSMCRVKELINTSKNIGDLTKVAKLISDNRYKVATERLKQVETLLKEDNE